MVYIIWFAVGIQIDEIVRLYKDYFKEAWENA